MKITEIIEKLDNEEMDSSEIKKMFEEYQHANSVFADLHRDKILGFVQGLAAVGFIRPEDVTQVNADLDLLYEKIEKRMESLQIKEIDKILSELESIAKEV